MEPTHTPLPLKGAHNHSSAPTIMRPLQGRFLFLIVFIVGASPYARLYSPFGAYKVGAEMRWPFCVFIGPFRDFFLSAQNPGHRAHGARDNPLPGGEKAVLLQLDLRGTWNFEP